MSQEDHKAGEVDEAQIVLRVILITNDQAAKVEQPGEKAFNFPTTLEATQAATILSDSVRPPSLPVWGNHFGAELLKHFPVQRIAVVGLVSNQSLRHIGHEPPARVLSSVPNFGN